MMTKDGRVNLGSTPSTVSGKPCEVITADGEPLRRKEDPADVSLKSAAAALDQPLTRPQPKE